MAFGVERPDTQFSIRVPGGVVLRPTVPTSNPSKFELAMSMMQQVGTLFAPIRPILSLVRFARALFDWVRALFDVLDIPPDLQRLREATDELAVAGADVLALEPTAAFVPFVLDVINAARKLLDGLDEKLSEIDAVVAQADAIRSASQQPYVTDAARVIMEDTADCLDEVADTLAASISDVLEPVDLLFQSINDIGRIFGTSLLPSIGKAETLDALRDVVGELRGALALLPV